MRNAIASHLDGLRIIHDSLHRLASEMRPDELESAIKGLQYETDEDGLYTPVAELVCSILLDATERHETAAPARNRTSETDAFNASEMQAELAHRLN